MRLRDRVLVWVQDDLRLLVVDVKTTEQENETGERSVAGDRLEPVI